MWKAGLCAGTVIFAAAPELPLSGPWSGILQFGALGILGFAVKGLFHELGEQRKTAQKERETHTATMDTLCNRWDGWEKSRHTDHETLTATLTDLRVNCAKQQANP